MRRRTAIKIAAIGALAPKLDALGSALGHAPASAGRLPSDDKLRFFTADEKELLDELMEMIIPADNHSPGAKAAEVSLFADRMVSTGSREEQQHWREGLKQMQVEARKSSLAEALAKAAAHEDHPTTDLERFFQTLKHMTVNGYYTSAIGIHQDLQYQGNAYLSAFPGCPLNEIGGSNQAAEQREKAQQAPQPRAPSDLSDGHEGSRT
ncbi:MAG: hypothetical protein DMG38_05950 [Acidobacteria bacterium]|nr:MAG: hypothetical protein DMG38_05950 [Acidobacteriota bacterium]